MDRVLVGALRVVGPLRRGRAADHAELLVVRDDRVHEDAVLGDTGRGCAAVVGSVLPRLHADGPAADDGGVELPVHPEARLVVRAVRVVQRGGRSHARTRCGLGRARWRRAPQPAGRRRSVRSSRPAATTTPKTLPPRPAMRPPNVPRATSAAIVRSDLSLRRSPVLVAELPLEHLAQRVDVGARRRIRSHAGTCDCVRSSRQYAMRLVGRHRRCGHDERDHGLAPLVVGDSDDRGLGHERGG